MKRAVVYYSYDGSSVLVAEALKGPLEADVFRIEAQDEKRRTGLAKYVWGGRQVFAQAKPALKPLALEPESCDLIVIGGPVWAGSPAPALVSWLDGARLKGKKIALFVCHRGGKGRAGEKLRALLEGNTIVGEVDFINPRKLMENGELERRISDWVKTLKA
jgi:flavodoxin